MDQLGTSPFSSIVEEALNDYFRNASNDSFSVLDVCADAASLRTRVFSLQNSENSPPVVKVSGASSSLIFTDQDSTTIEPVAERLDQIEVSSAIIDLQERIRWGLSLAKIKRFDIIITYRAVSILSSIQFSKGIEEETCQFILKKFKAALVNGGLLVLGDLYSPSWRKVSRSDSLTNDSLTQHTDEFLGIKPDKLIELATYKLSYAKRGYAYLRVPLFNVRITHPPATQKEVKSKYLASEKYFDDGTREFALALERSTKPFDDSRIVETVKQENEAILARLERHIKQGREDSTPRDYRKRLKAFLSLDDHPDDSLYARLARSLYLQVLLEQINGPTDLLSARMIFWMAYESSAANSEVIAASEPNAPYPLFGYSFGPPHNDKPSHQSLSRYWLNIILNNDGFSASKSGVTPLHPPSVHEWFVRHSPKVVSRAPWDEQPLETLTLYLGKSENRRLALIEGHNSSRRHHRIELAPFKFSNEGEDWGFQLAEELSKILSALPMSPYDDVPWPFEDIDRVKGLIPNEITVAAFRKETDRIRACLDLHQPLDVSRGWLRANLYSVFLAMCLGEVRERLAQDPKWLTFFKTVLSRLGYGSLIKQINDARAASANFLLESGQHQDLSSLTWVAPPVLLSLIGTKRRPLGSILIISSQLLPVTTFKQLKNQLLSTFVSLREGEELIESERRARRTSLLEGHSRSVEDFSHELSKFADAISRDYLLPLDKVFQVGTKPLIRGHRPWATLAGSIITKKSSLKIIKEWRVCPTPSLIRGISDVLYMWSSSPRWWETQKLHRGQTIQEALNVIRQIGIRAGVAIRVGISSDRPDSITNATNIEDDIHEFEEMFESIVPQIEYSGPDLFWQGVAETRFAELVYTRMFVVSISNAVNSLDLDEPRCRIKVEAGRKDLAFTLTNSCKGKASDGTRLPYYASTRSVLQNCVRILNNGADVDKSLTFTRKKTTWITKTRVSLIVRSREGTEVEWLRKLS